MIIPEVLEYYSKIFDELEKEKTMPEWIEIFTGLALSTKILCKPDYFNLTSLDEIFDYVKEWDMKLNGGKYSYSTSNQFVDS